MSQINNDHEMREQMAALDVSELRVVAALFVQSILDIGEDAKISAALDVASRASVTEEEQAAAYKLARAASVETATRCGADCNWQDQAAHFVARATSTLLAPNTKDMPWQVATNCRLARNCALLAQGDDSENPEVENQYNILDEFLQAKVLPQ